MVTLGWCGRKKRGIRLIEPNDNLAEEYLQTAEETLEVLKAISGKSKVWLATTKYYCEYFAAYSLLMKIGIKCEIHECTVALSRELERLKLMPEGFSSRLEADKQLRIDNQYYLKNKEVLMDYDLVLGFILAIKDTIHKLTRERIILIRKEIKEKMR